MIKEKEKTFTTKKTRGLFPHILKHWKFPGTPGHFHIQYRFRHCGNGNCSVHYTQKRKFQPS